MLLTSTHYLSEHGKLGYHLFSLSEEFNTPITKISVPTQNQSQIDITTKRESENKQFNEVRQLAYIFEVEGTRSYSINRITRVTKCSEDLTDQD